MYSTLLHNQQSEKKSAWIRHGFNLAASKWIQMRYPVQVVIFVDFWGNDENPLDLTPGMGLR